MKILSFGAGMQSTALALMSCENVDAERKGHERPYPLVPVYDLVVFCDLGFEPPWVMQQAEFVHRACDTAGIRYQSWNGKSSRRRSGRVGGRRLRSRTRASTTCGNAMRRSRRRSRYSAACGRRAKSRNTSSRNGFLHSKKSRSRLPRSCGIGKDQRRSIYVAAGIQSIILRRSSGSRGQ